MNLPLFEALPALRMALPHAPLLAGPTPVDDLGEIHGARLLVKRDDLTCPRYGGNKARKLEFVLGAALARGAREVWTVGGLCSNHCTATAVYAHALGLRATLLYTPTPLDAGERDLLLVQVHLGATLRLLPAVGAWPRLWSRPRPFLVPPGGSSTAGVFGYVNAGLELAQQVRTGAAPAPEALYIAAASQGTARGLAMGLALGGLRVPITAVETVTPGWQAARALLPTPARAYRRLRRADAALPSWRDLLPARNRRYEAIPLGARDARVQAALTWAAERGLEADAHFSGKTLAALLEDLAAGRLAGKTTLYWHTHGRLPATLRNAAVEAGARLPPDLERAVARWLR